MHLCSKSFFPSHYSDIDRVKDDEPQKIILKISYIDDTIVRLKLT
jgi:hypothetical protein